MKFKPIKQQRVSEAVFERLKEAILLGYFEPGDKLPSERHLAEEFKCSRMSIREATRALERSGFVVTRQGVTGGTYVTNLTFEYLGNAFLDLFLADKLSIPELHQVRIIIEPEVARLAAKNVTTESGKRLQDALDMEAPANAPLSECLEKDTRVHYLLAEICGNRFFEAIVNSFLKLNTKIVQTVKPDPMAVHPPGMHRPVVEAVLAKNAEKAARAMRKHAIEFGKNLMKMEKDYRRIAGLID